MNENPYGTPESMGGQFSREDALAKVSTPATLLLVTGILGVIAALATFALPSFLPSIMQGIAESAAEQDPNFDQEQFDQMISMVGGIQMYISGAIGLIGSIVTCLGALKMKALTGYGLAMAGSICAICPYVSPCCCFIFPMGIGIWSIVVLANGEVKSHFS
ncbi:MAG: hypothetical protein AB8B50_06135 [Pirellulaceae bacterium]